VFLGCLGGLLGRSWELFGVLGASGGNPERGLGEPWKALDGLGRLRSKKSLFVDPILGVKIDAKSLKIVFKNDQVFRRVSVNAFHRFPMFPRSFFGT
jgi:hypothetical protein